MIWPCHVAPRQTPFPWLTSLCAGESLANEKKEDQKTWPFANIKEWTGLACVAGGFVGGPQQSRKNEPRKDKNKPPTASYADKTGLKLVCARIIEALRFG